MLSVTCGVYTWDNTKLQNKNSLFFTDSQALQRNTVVIKLTSAYGRPPYSSNIREGQSITA
jgi:hypothetical protein